MLTVPSEVCVFECASKEVLAITKHLQKTKHFERVLTKRTTTTTTKVLFQTELHQNLAMKHNFPRKGKM